MGYKMYAAGAQQWRADMVGLNPTQVQQAYDQGFAGAYFDSDAHEQRRAQSIAACGYADVEDIAHANTWADSSAGQLVCTFLHTLEAYPGCWPGPAQQRGDCVSHGEKNSNLFTLCCDVASGMPDQKTGLIEGLPEISQAGILQGALSTEWYYWFRGHGGDGWSCDSSASVSVTYGNMLRQQYSDLGIDLTTYSGSLAGKYGPGKPPENMQAVGRLHLTHTTANCRTAEATRDALGNGHGINTCGGEGFSSTRNEHGVSSRQGSWSHSMAFIAFDDRPWAHQTYGGPLVLVLNSWAKFNVGPRDIHDSAKLVPAEKRELWSRIGITNLSTGNIMIPEGAFWARWKDVSSRQIIARSGIVGWKPKKCNPLLKVFG